MFDSSPFSPATKDVFPAMIRQGPFGFSQDSPGDPYWYQSGAMGTAATFNYVGANVTIRTVYDNVNNDAHSYWVGGYISNGVCVDPNCPFIQVGYLNEVTTTNEPYCCAWFYEYFPDPNSGCCAPVIGREGSAGPIGSWHTYSMVQTGGGVWSFYMDGNLLGKTPSLGNNSGNHAPAGMAEVAQASTNTDVLGPAEFKGLSFRIGSVWQPVLMANSFIYYGEGTPQNPQYTNPYGVSEVEGIDNDFLAGSYIPQLNSPSPSPGSSLWPTSTPSYIISFTFLDMDGAQFDPTWVSLRPSFGRPIFYTTYQNQRINFGNWTVSQAMWHNVNVASLSSTIQVTTDTQATVQGRVFSVTLHVVGLVSGLPVSGATVFTLFPDSINITAKTDSSGDVILHQLPPASYLLHVTVPFGIPAAISEDIQGPGALTARVLGIVEIILIIALPILGAVIVAIVAVRRERRRAAMASLLLSPTLSPICAVCRRSLLPSDSVCAGCGSAVKPSVA